MKFYCYHDRVYSTVLVEFGEPPKTVAESDLPREVRKVLLYGYVVVHGKERRIISVYADNTNNVCLEKTEFAGGIRWVDNLMIHFKNEHLWEGWL